MPKPYTATHDWVAATNVDVPPGRARMAFTRGTMRVAVDTKVEVLDVYCRQCRRPFDAVEGQPCAAADNRDHLIGGPTGERKKRKHNHDCTLLGCDVGPAAASG